MNDLEIVVATQEYIKTHRLLFESDDSALSSLRGISFCVYE